MDLANAYDKVVRQLLLDKLVDKGVPVNLVNQLRVFLLPLLVHTAGDITRTIATLTTGLVQGGTASPSLFRFFINDVAEEMRAVMATERDGTGTSSLDDPGKLVADDVILIANSAGTMQQLLDVCTA